MSCTPSRPCGPPEPALALTPPPAGLRRLSRRIGAFEDFVAVAVREIEQTRPAPGAPPLGAGWDVEGDPLAQQALRLWAYVAETVAAYTELTAGESYLGTAADWTDLRRLGALVGFRPRQRVAATGWVRVDTDRGASPVVPVGTRVQAPAAPGRTAQTFEVAEDTALRADWADLTATPVPTPGVPTGRVLRFLHDPGFAPGDRVLFVLEESPATVPPVSVLSTWWGYWAWLLVLVGLGPSPASTPLGVAVVEKRGTELGTALVTFDRDLAPMLPAADKSYAAYRVLTSAGSARRLGGAVKLAASSTFVELGPLYPSSAGSAISTGSTGSTVTLDTALDAVSTGQLVALVDWQSGACDVATTTGHTPVSWQVAPGAPSRVSRLSFAGSVATLANAGGHDVTAYVVDRRVAARHYTLPTTVTGTPPRLRVYPAPDPGEVMPRLAVRVGTAEGLRWQLFRVAPSAVQESDPAGDAPRGLLLDLLDGAPLGLVDRAPATGNVAPVHHGETTSSTLGSGDAATAGQRLPVPKAPVAADLGPDGAPASSLELRVDGLRWDERPTLYAAGPAEVFTTRLDPDGAVTTRFGDGVQGARLPTGRGNVQASYRVGGGTAGEVPGGAIDSLIGSLRGVKGVGGVGATTGGADQDDERRLRRLAPARTGVLGRAVSRADLADLALGFPGVSHAGAWRGAGPAGCACGGSGEHLAFLRLASTGPRVPSGAEVTALATYVDERRDPSVPLCVAAASVSALAVTAALATDPRRVSADVAAAASAAVVASGGPLDPVERELGQPLDRSDVLAVLHAVPGVLGVVLTLAGSGVVGRVAAARSELLVPATPVAVTASPAGAA